MAGQAQFQQSAEVQSGDAQLQPCVVFLDSEESQAPVPAGDQPANGSLHQGPVCPVAMLKFGLPGRGPVGALSGVVFRNDNFTDTLGLAADIPQRTGLAAGPEVHVALGADGTDFTGRTGEGVVGIVVGEVIQIMTAGHCRT